MLPASSARKAEDPQSLDTGGKCPSSVVRGHGLDPNFLSVCPLLWEHTSYCCTLLSPQLYSVLPDNQVSSSYLYPAWELYVTVNAGVLPTEASPLAPALKYPLYIEDNQLELS